MYTFKKENSWQRHQAEFLLKKKKKLMFVKALPLFLSLAAFLVLGLGALVFYWPADRFDSPREPAHSVEKPMPRKDVLSKQQLRRLIGDIHFLNAKKDIFTAGAGAEKLQIKASLDPDLQEFLVDSLDRLKTLTRGKPQRIAMVAMDARDGGIIAMAGFDLDDPKANPCLSSDFPAASIFKIVTATAAMDSLGYTPQTPVHFNGNKYTLYKRQLKETRNRYTVKTTLAEAFAESVNPVFGKLGKNVLGRERLNAYAHAFGFNETPVSELNFESGRFRLRENDYYLAELGCGFNTDTKISPIFGAMMVTAVLNSGKSLMPAIVDQVKNLDGEVIYKHKKEVYKTSMAPASAEKMISLMEKTISRGTARKAFRGISRDRILSKLVIGGKTGSLYNKEHTVKYDWFTGFGKPKTGGRSLAVSIVVGHRKYIGTRASSYGKMILRQYFKNSGQEKAALHTKSTDTNHRES